MLQYFNVNLSDRVSINAFGTEYPIVRSDRSTKSSGWMGGEIGSVVFSSSSQGAIHKELAMNKN
jgi:hypothetical protein